MLELAKTFLLIKVFFYAWTHKGPDALSKKIVWQSSEDLWGKMVNRFCYAHTIQHGLECSNNRKDRLPPAVHVAYVVNS